MLVAQLDARDSIALVTFSNDGALRLAMTPVTDRAAIEAAIAPLVPDGSTNSNAGLQLGYAQALAGLDREAVNRVVFLSDGVANVGETDAQKITDGVKGIREKGIYLNTIGVGMNNHNDALLEQLADLGDGVCNYVDGPQEIQRALVERFTGAFQPVAKDVKIQVEFDPSQVLRYRLLGYENRAIADADFRNDAVDAGEVGAGHQVTALYEIEPTGVASNAPMATVRVRWKQIRPAGESGVQEATEAAFGVRAASYTAYEAAPIGHRRALIVAQFAEILRRSIHARGDSLDDLIREATNLQAQIPNDAEFAEFTALLVRTKELVLRALPACDEMCQTVDALRSNAYLGAVFQETGRDATALAQVEAERQKLEARLRELLIRQAQAEGALPLQSLGYTGEPR
jgi:Ca-activated chloride channel family protein